MSRVINNNNNTTTNNNSTTLNDGMTFRTVTSTNSSGSRGSSSGSGSDNDMDVGADDELVGGKKLPPVLVISPSLPHSQGPGSGQGQGQERGPDCLELVDDRLSFLAHLPLTVHIGMRLFVCLFVCWLVGLLICIFD